MSDDLEWETDEIRDAIESDRERALKEPYNQQQVHWFGEPWPSETRRAPVCWDDRYRIATPVGHHCLDCGKPIKADERGVLTGASPSLWGAWEVNGVYRVAFHLGCWLREVVGGEMSRKLMERLEGRTVPDDYQPASHVTAKPVAGRGWRHKKTVSEASPEGGAEQAEVDVDPERDRPEAGGS